MSHTSFVRFSYAAATLPFLSCEKILLPNRLASAARTECGISVSKTRMLDPIAERKEEIISFALFVRLSTMVSKMPSILNRGLICRFTLEIECISKFRPFVDKKFGCDGMITLSAATSELTVIIPREGIQSIKI